MKKYCQQAGFTLSEILIAILIFTLVIGAIYSIYHLSQWALQESERAVELTQNGRVILERMTREIRQAKEIATELPAMNAIEFEDGHITEPYHYIHYYLEDRDVNRKVVGYYFSGDPTQTFVPWDSIPPGGQTLETKTLEETKIIGEYVTNLNFSGLEVINISITLEKKNKSIKMGTQVFGRNI